MTNPKQSKNQLDNLKIVQNERIKAEDQLKEIQNQLVELIHKLKLSDEEK